MPIIRHTTRLLNAEVREKLPLKLHVKNDITIRSVERTEGRSSDESVTFHMSYEFKATYNETVAEITIQGETVYVTSSETAEEIEKSWEERKALPEKVMLEVGNFCLMKAQMQAVMLANELDIQSPVRLPQIEPRKKG